MGLAIRFLSAFKSAVTFVIHRPKDAAIMLLIFLLALMGWKLNSEKNRTHELVAKIEGLPPGTKQTITIYKDCIVTKWREGPSKIVYQDRYLPPEGRVDVAIKDDKLEVPPDIRIKDRGFTRLLGGGFIYSTRFLPELDVKWVYWRRYSATVGVTPHFGGMGISRHIDDLLPFENLEILGIGGVGWQGQRRFGIGLRLNF